MSFPTVPSPDHMLLRAAYFEARSRELSQALEEREGAVHTLEREKAVQHVVIQHLQSACEQKQREFQALSDRNVALQTEVDHLRGEVEATRGKRRRRENELAPIYRAIEDFGELKCISCRDHPVFAVWMDFVEHIEDKHGSRYQCSQEGCSHAISKYTTTSFTTSLSSHILNHLIKTPKVDFFAPHFDCTLCEDEITFHSLQEVLEHGKKEHSDEIKSNSCVKYSCLICRRDPAMSDTVEIPRKMLQHMVRCHYGKEVDPPSSSCV